MIPPAQKPTDSDELAASGFSLKSPRRIIDTSGVVVFHLSIFLLIALSIGDFAPVLALMALLILAVDLILFVMPPDRKPILDPEPGAEKETETETKTAPVRAFALELLVLLVPPAILVSWFLFLIWNHLTLTRNESIALLIAVPADVVVVTQIIKIRLTRYHVGIHNNTTTIIGLSMIATWLGSFFLFFPLLFCVVIKLSNHSHY